MTARGATPVDPRPRFRASESDRGDQRALGLGGAVLLIVIGLASEPRWPWMAGAIVVPVLALWLVPTRRWRLGDGELVLRTRGRVEAMAVAGIVRVEREWVPRGGHRLRIEDGQGGSLTVHAESSATRDLRHALGRELGARAWTVATDPQVRAALGLVRR